MSKDTNIIYGIHAIEEALDAGAEINKLVVAKGLQNEQVERIIKRVKQLSLPVQFVPRESDTFPRQKNHQGVVAFVSPISYHKLEDVLPAIFERGEVPFIMVLDHITDVRNFGAIARSALCGGVHAIVIPETGAAQVTDDAIKTSAGALTKIPVCREKNFKTVMELINQSGLTTVGFSEKANKELPFVDFTEPIALILGNEEKGLSMDVLKRCTVLTKIPMDQGVGSLNVSVAAGIGVYEVVRQRMQ